MTTTMTEPNQQTVQRITDELKLLRDHLTIHRRVVHAGDNVYQAGEAFHYLYVLNAGFFKVVNMAVDGREQVVALHFKGDWLGLDGIATGQYGCDAVAMDTGEVWAIQYEMLLEACARQPALMNVLHGAMSREIGRHTARRRPGRGLPALLGRRARAAWPAYRPDHAAHVPRRDRQLSRHDARDGEPRVVAAGARRRHPLQRKGSA